MRALGLVVAASWGATCFEKPALQLRAWLVVTVGVTLWGQLTMFEGMDHELMLFVNTLGVSIMVLVVLYHALVARQRDTG